MAVREAAVVVAGGRGERLGAPEGGKASLRISGETLLERVLAAVTQVVSEVVVVAAPGQSLALPPTAAGVAVVRDSRVAGGPLAAVADGLRELARRPHPPQRCLLVACDMPLLKPALLRRLLQRCGETASGNVAWVVPVIDGHRQVLASALAFTAQPIVEAMVAAGRRDLRGLAEVLPCGELTHDDLVAVDPHLDSFRDIDTAEDLKTIEFMTDPDLPVFSPLVEQLLAAPDGTPRLPELGPGRPVAGHHEALAKLTLEQLFEGCEVCDAAAAECCVAGLWLWNNGLDESHRISQSLETAEGSYWHGIMHRREPDPGNAKYWFRLVGRHPVFPRLAEVAAGLADGTGFAGPADSWNPAAFIDWSCSVAAGSTDEKKAREIAAAEWRLLFAHCFGKAVVR